MNYLLRWNRLKINRHILFSSLLMLAASLFPGWAISADLPRNWPWHGLNMDSLSNTPDDVFHAKKTLGVNSLQLQVWVKQLAKRDKITAEMAWLNSMNWLDMMLDACRSEQLSCIVNISWFPIEPADDYDQSSPRFWFSDLERNKVKMLAKKLAEHLKTRGEEFAAYDVLAEPVMLVMNKTVVPPQWDAFQKELIETIRAQDANRWIVVKTAPWGMQVGYSTFKPLQYEQLIYGAHMYSPHAFTHQGIKIWPYGAEYPGFVDGQYWDKNELSKSLQALINFGAVYSVPIWVGEFSALRWAKGGEIYLIDLVDIFDKQSWGWCYFNVGFWHGWNPNFDDKYNGVEGANSLKLNRIGESSPRWITLRKLFKVQ